MRDTLMESSRSTENLAKMEQPDGNKIHLVLIVIAVLLAVIAIILACIGISQRGSTNISLPPYDGSAGGTTADYGDKIWSIALGHGDYNEAYIDPVTGELRGFLVDLSNAVCKVANKNCMIVYDIWTRCWDSERGQVARGGIGLMGQWYDMCAGWLQTYDRARTYAFSLEFGRASVNTLYVKPGSSLKSSWNDMTDRKIGILDGWAADEFCLTRNDNLFTAGVPFTEAHIMHYADRDALVDAISGSEIDFAFLNKGDYEGLEIVDDYPDLKCDIQGSGMMVRKVDKPVLDWINPALMQLLASPEYENICRGLDEEHGHKPGTTSDQLCFLKKP